MSSPGAAMHTSTGRRVELALAGGAGHDGVMELGLSGMLAQLCVGRHSPLTPDAVQTSNRHFVLSCHSEKSATAPAAPVQAVPRASPDAGGPGGSMDGPLWGLLALPPPAD